MKYLDLFTGIGGFSLGINQAYNYVDTTNGKKNRGSKTATKNGIGKRYKKSESVSTERGRNGKHNNSNSKIGQELVTCVGFSEIDKYAEQIYKKHFPNHKNYGDITKIDTSTLPVFDLLVGGFPCQSFSIAGKRGGFDDTRGTLFFEIARILQDKRPKQLLLENVKGLLSHDDGKTFRRIISTLAGLGYDLQWQVLNSKDFGVPQNRERVFIIGHLRGIRRPQVFPFNFGDPVDGEVREEQNKKGSRASCLNTRYGQRWTDETYIGTYRTHKDGQGFRKKADGLDPTIPARAREDGSGQPVIIQRSRGKNKGGIHSVAPTVTGKSYQDNNHLHDGMSIRRLTPIECERLQGFPDGWTNYGVDLKIDGGGIVTISDTQRYKCLGNAVTVNVVREIIKSMFNKN